MLRVMALNPKQKRFVDEYLLDLNAAAAAVRAGYSAKTAKQIGARLLAQPAVAATVKAAQAQRSARVEVTQDEVLRELLRIARVDVSQAYDEAGNLKPIHELPVDLRRAIASVETEERFVGQGASRKRVGVTHKVKFWPKDRSLELLGKHLGMFIERHRHELGKSLEQLLADALSPSASAAPKS